MKRPPGKDYNAWEVTNTDFLNQRVAPTAKDVEGKERIGVSPLRPGADLGHLAGPRETGQPRIDVERMVDRLRIEPGLAKEIEQRAGIDGAGARRHRHSLERRNEA